MGDDPEKVVLAVTVAISTMGERLERIVLPPEQQGLNYLVLIQKPDVSTPNPTLARADVILTKLDNIGLSNSRNAALECATDGLVVFADDDLELDPAGLMELRDAFAADPMLALAAGWRRDNLARAEKKTGERPGAQRLRIGNSGRICAPELMVHADAVRAAGLQFDPAFGLGAKFGLGEEFIFVTDALKAGLKGISLPVVTGSHADESTGDDWADPDLMRARAAMLDRVFGIWWPLARVAYAWRYRHRMGGFRSALRFLTRGRHG